MANDNLLAGLAGAAEGVKDVLVPWMQMRQKANIDDQLSRNRLREQSAQEMNQRLSLLPFEEASQMRLKKQEQGATLSREKELQTQRLGAQAEMERSKDYVNGQDILDLYPQLRNQGIEPNRRYNKALINNLVNKQSGQAEKQTDAIQQQIDRLSALQGDLKTLRGQYASTAGAGNGAIVGGLASAASRTPLGFGSFLAPDTSEYNKLRGSVGIQLQRELTGSSRMLKMANEAETAQIPEPGHPRAPALFDEVERKLEDRIVKLQQRKAQFGGSSFQPGGHGDDMNGYTEAQKRAIQSGKW